MTFFQKFFRARTTDPETSKQAAEQAEDLANKHFSLIHLALIKNGALGKDGIAYVTGLDGNQVARRLPEMQRLGVIELTGQKVESLSGRMEREWRAKK